MMDANQAAQTASESDGMAKYRLVAINGPHEGEGNDAAYNPAMNRDNSMMVLGEEMTR